MLKLLAFGIGAGMAVQALRNWPPDGPLTQNSVAVIALIGLVAAYLGGRWAGRGNGAHASATAVAVAAAQAEASGNTVNLFVAAQSGSGAAPVGMSYPDEAAPWIGQHRRELSLDELDGADLDELLETHAEVVE